MYVCEQNLIIKKISIQIPRRVKKTHFCNPFNQERECACEATDMNIHLQTIIIIKREMSQKRKKIYAS
jgi:hypothetical protein